MPKRQGVHLDEVLVGQGGGTSEVSQIASWDVEVGWDG